MPDRSRTTPAQSERLALKVILPRQGVEKKVPVGGSALKIFRTVDRNFRNTLSVRINAIQEGLSQLNSRVPVPVRVKLLLQASAKSHRPEYLFSERTCPIIGAGKLGELFIKATPDGLKKVQSIIRNQESPRAKKEISTVETFEPITPEYRLDNLSPEDILRRCPKKDERYVLKVQLFDFGDDDQQPLVNDFVERCDAAKIIRQRDGYSPSSAIFRVECQNVDQVRQLAKIVGVRSIRPMPVLMAIRLQELALEELPSDLPKPNAPEEYPVVVVVDSGIDDRVPGLGSWVVGSDSTVAKEYRNPRHGTFIAGLLCWGGHLNNHIKKIGNDPCKIFDLQVMPNTDPQAGETTDLCESELLEDLENALQKHGHEYKVWNISLGLNAVCSLDEFSSLAVELDRLQEQYGVSFVISAGNYTTPPLLPYPRTGRELEAGRITSPADSALGIAVGAITHVAQAKTGPRAGEPSPFSRHGPGPNYIIKPDLVHYGGSCDMSGRNQQGIRSVSPKGIIEDMGTSFSAPLVSGLLANVYHKVKPTPSPSMARAILVHHARHPITDERVPDKEENFFGFGLPRTVDECLKCPPWASTLVFEEDLRPGYFLEWDDFPYPDSLHRGGKFFGDIWMTLAFAPARGNRWGTEYCQTHVEAHFGVHFVRRSRSGIQKPMFRGLVPPEHKNPGILYESYQVEKLRKWAPVRTYFGSLGNNGERGQRCRLSVNLLYRHGIRQDLLARPQRFALILTIADPEKKAPVYNEMAVKLRQRYQVENLALRPEIQIQQEE